MAYQEDIELMAHLMRRASFGAGRDELEARVAKGYEATVEELLHPETQPAVDMYTLLRYQPASLLPGGQPPMGNVNFMYHLVNTKRPLEEKMALFWHHVFATGNSKVDNYDQLLEQIGLFRRHGMGNYRDLLVTIARNPTMIFWLATTRTTGRPSTRTGVGSCSSCSAWASAPTRRRTSVKRRAPSPAGPSRPRFRGCPTGGSRGSSSTGPKITTMARRSFSATAAASTAKTSSTSSWNNRPVRASCADTCTTSSSPTSLRCPPGRSSRLESKRRSTR